MKIPKALRKALKKSPDLQLKVYDKVLGERILRLPLAEQVKLARKLSIGPMPMVRANLLKQMPHDVMVYAKQGMTGPQIKTMYWNCKEFREWWLLLELQEATLDVLISDTLGGANESERQNMAPNEQEASKAV